MEVIWSRKKAKSGPFFFSILLGVSVLFKGELYIAWGKNIMTAAMYVAKKFARNTNANMSIMTAALYVAKEIARNTNANMLIMTAVKNAIIKRRSVYVV
ncbi:hypothetical protein [Peribacillus alkalitolerans]|uniref:hypothetical protein n=1 Tax=Peribacillus alkalitolerans TaxID=1550385 RepID=UPI001F0754D5|nr:hypothetical protein [Peribacillus alkalitolerans]